MRQPAFIRAAIQRMPESTESIDAFKNEPAELGLAAQIGTSVRVMYHADLLFTAHYLEE